MQQEHNKSKVVLRGMRRGFTIVELLVVIGLIMVMTALSVSFSFNYQVIRRKRVFKGCYWICRSLYFGSDIYFGLRGNFGQVR